MSNLWIKTKVVALGECFVSDSMASLKYSTSFFLSSLPGFLSPRRARRASGRTVSLSPPVDCKVVDRPATRFHASERTLVGKERMRHDGPNKETPVENWSQYVIYHKLTASRLAPKTMSSMSYNVHPLVVWEGFLRQSHPFRVTKSRRQATSCDQDVNQHLPGNQQNFDRTLKNFLTNGNEGLMKPQPVQWST